MDTERITYTPKVDESDHGRKDLLQVRGLRFAHSDGPTIFQSLNLTVRQGETVVIMGGSGVGKTTLANLIFELRSRQGSKGVIKMDRKRAALVLQEGAVFEHLDVGGNLALVLRRRKQKPVPQRLREILLAAEKVV